MCAQLAKAWQHLALQKEVVTGLHSHNMMLQREARRLSDKLEAAHVALRDTRGEVVEMHRRWQQATYETRELQARVEMEQELRDDAKMVASEACASEAAVRRVLLGEAEYHLAEECGYQLDTIVSMKPSNRSVTVLGGPRHWAAV